MSHLYVGISHHGFGHLAISAAVLNPLFEQCPSLQITIQSGLPETLVRRFVSCEFHYVMQATDPGMVMQGALTVLGEESHQAFKLYQQNWSEKITNESSHLLEMGVDLVLSNVSYGLVAAAKQAGIPSVLLCPLNWADIYYPYAKAYPDAEELRRWMVDCYQMADEFLLPQPAMPTEWHHKITKVGPIARTSVSIRGQINRQYGLPDKGLLVLIALGGVPTRIPIEYWPVNDEVTWVIPQQWQVKRDDCLIIEELEVSFVGLLSSCDLIISKPGYGTFAESVCNDIPVLYVRRHGWPEEPYLIEWLHENGRALELAKDSLDRGDILEEIESVLALPRMAKVEASGVKQTMAILQNYLKDSA